MCLIFIAHQHHPDFDLVVAANRDEFYARPTAVAGFWPDHPEILAGRDLEAGGTWLGVSTRGRFAALTNFRSVSERRRQPPSRGALVSGFLLDDTEVAAYSQALLPRAPDYNGFGLLLLAGGVLGYVSNGVAPVSQILAPGLYGLSNHLLDTPWPKLAQGKRSVQQCLDDGADVEQLFEIMASRRVAEDEALPDTGVGLELERNYSPAFVDMPHYGTRCTSVLRVAGGAVEFYERTYTRGAEQPSTVVFRFDLD